MKQKYTRWCRLHHNLADHPKIRRAGPVAAGTYLVLLAKASDIQESGFIAEETAQMYLWPGHEEALETLITVGLVERVDGGIRLHDYNEWNPERDGITRPSTFLQVARRQSLPDEKSDETLDWQRLWDLYPKRQGSKAGVTGVDYCRKNYGKEDYEMIEAAILNYKRKYFDAKVKSDGVEAAHKYTASYYNFVREKYQAWIPSELLKKLEEGDTPVPPQPAEPAQEEVPIIARRVRPL